MARRWTIACGWVAGVGLLVLTAHAAPPAEVPGLIQQLGAQDGAARENAQARLVALGTAARSALLAALDSKDPEIQVRAAHALELLRTQTARTQPLWNENQNTVLGANMVAGQVGERQMIFTVSDNRIAAREVTPAKPGEPPQRAPASVWDAAIPDGRVGWLALAGNRLLATTIGSRLVALDAQTGKELWSYSESDVPPQGIAPAPPRGAAVVPVAPAAAAIGRAGRGPASVIPGLSQVCVEGDVAYVASSRMLAAIDLNNGHALWQTMLPNGAIGAPTLSKDQVFVSSPSGVHIFNRKGGAAVATVAAGKIIYSAPVVVDGRIIVGTLEGLAAFDATHDEPLWVHSPSTMKLTFTNAANAAGVASSTVVPPPGPGRVSVGMAAPVFDHGVLIYSSIDTMYSLDPATGAERWKWQPTLLPGSAAGAPGPAAGAAVVAISIAARTTPSISAPTFVHDGQQLLVATNLGLYALDTKHGLIDWEYHVGELVITPPPASTTAPLQPVVANEVVQAQLIQREARPAAAGGAGGGRGRATVVVPTNAAVAVNAVPNVITNRLVGLPLNAPAEKTPVHPSP